MLYSGKDNMSVQLLRKSPSPSSEIRSNLGRVLLIAPQPFFLIRGTPINVRAMLESLGSAGYEVDLLAYPIGEDISVPGVKVHRTMKLPFVNSVPIGPSLLKLPLDFLLFCSALRLVLKNKYAVIHGVEEGGILACLLSRAFRIPFVYDMDSCMSAQLKQAGFLPSSILVRAFDRIEGYCMKRASAILTVCRALSRKVEKSGCGSRVHQIEDFPYPPATLWDSAGLAKITAEFGSEGTSIVYTGNLSTYQGIDLLLRAFVIVLKNSGLLDASLWQEAPLARLLIVGGGKRDADPVLKYQKLARSLGIDHAVVFTGNRPAEEMGAFQEYADVLVSPRIDGENTPLKLYSYMASGTPIVATNIISHTQVLSSETAFLAEPAPAAFAEALELAIDKTSGRREESRQRALRAKQLVETRYSEAEFSRRLLAMYEKVLTPEQLQDRI